MSTDTYIEKEVAKIFGSSEDYTLKSAKAAAWVLAHFKGVNLKIYKTQNLNPLADFFVLGSVENKVQASSVSSAISQVFKDKELHVKSVEGTEDGEWILIDLGDVIVHIFQETTRDIFDLDNLWRNYPQIEVPNDYYYSSHTAETSAAGSTKSSNKTEDKDENNLKNYF